MKAAPQLARLAQRVGRGSRAGQSGARSLPACPPARPRRVRLRSASVRGTGEVGEVAGAGEGRGQG